MSDCNCPNPETFEDIPASNCAVDLKQLQRVFFQLPGYIWDTVGLPATDISTLADWQALKVAVDDTKVACSPIIAGDPAIIAGEAVTEGGGDNSTLNGVTLVNGTNPSQFTARFDSISQAQEIALKQFMCYKNVGVYFVNEGDKIIAKKTSVATQHTSIPIQSYFFSDRTNEGYGTKDSNMMTFMLKAGWSETIDIITPEAGFSPLTDL